MDKPHITPKGTDRFSVRFPCGGTAEVCKVESTNHLPDWRWHAVTADGQESPPARPDMTSDGAFRGAWCFVRPAPKAIEGYDVAQCLAAEDHDRNAYTKELRKMLKERTGRTWSVRGGTGTAYMWIDICAPPARLVGHHMTPDDESLLSSVLGRDRINQHYQIPPTRGYWSWTMAKIAGIPTDKITLAVHGWD